MKSGRGRVSGKLPIDVLQSSFKKMAEEGGDAAFCLGVYDTMPSARAADVQGLAGIGPLLAEVLHAQPNGVLNHSLTKTIVQDVYVLILNKDAQEAQQLAEKFTTQLRIALSHLRPLVREPQRFKQRCKGIPEASVRTVQELIGMFRDMLPEVPEVPSSWERPANSQSAPPQEVPQPTLASTTSAAWAADVARHADAAEQTAAAQSIIPEQSASPRRSVSRRQLRRELSLPSFSGFSPAPEDPAPHDLSIAERAELRALDAQRAKRQIPIAVAGLLIDMEIRPRPAGFRENGQAAAVHR